MAYHEGIQVWLPQVQLISSVTADGSNKKRVTNWRRGSVEVRNGIGSDATPAAYYWARGDAAYMLCKA
jgi:hypothetical protein